VVKENTISIENVNQDIKSFGFKTALPKQTIYLLKA